MNKAYERINWENYPSENTALNETNLNKMDASLNEVDNRVVAHETTKLDKATANSMVRNISFNERTGIFTVTYLNGSTKELDTKLEKIATNFVYDEERQKLILTLIDGTTQEIDMSALITQYEFENSAYINWTVVDGKVKAEIINGSITADKLQPNFLADVTLQANSAKTSEQNAKTSEENAKQSEINAKNYAESAEPVASTAKGANPTLESSTDAPFISFKGDGKTTQAIEKYFIELTEVSGGVQTNIIDCKSGDEVVLDCGVARTIGYYVYLGDGLSMYEEGSANVQVYTFTADGKMQFIIKGGTLGDNITITVNGSEYNNPSPDNPVPIHGVGESGSLEVKCTGKNFLPNTFTSQTLNSVTLTVNEDKTISVSGTNNKNTAFSIKVSNNFTLPAGTYRLSGNPFSDGETRMFITTSDGRNYFDHGNGGIFTISEETKFSCWFVFKGATTFNGVIKPMIHLATETDDTYEPYTETTANIPLSSPLYEGDYIKYNMDGSGEESHKQFEMVLDGSEDWKTVGSFAIDGYFALSIGGYGYAKRSNIVCSHFVRTTITTSSSIGIDTINSATYNESRIVVRPKIDGVTDLATWKAWLAENPITVVYELAEPTVTPLTAEQIAEFEKLRTFDGTTHITCEAECEIDYFRDSVSGKAVAMIANMLKK